MYKACRKEFESLYNLLDVSERKGFLKIMNKNIFKYFFPLKNKQAEVIALW